MATYMVQYGFQRSQLGFGSAVAVILFFISLILALLYQRFVLRRDLQAPLSQGVR
jgi:raffinose/stachyose/melibiose transport system permease protein